MAKFALESAIGELNIFHYNFDAASMDIVDSSETEIEIADAQGDKMVLKGSGFTFEDGDLTSGSVTVVEFYNATGNLLLTVSELDLDVDFVNLSNVRENFFTFEQGNDTFTGSSIGDVIMYGDNTGNDKINGMGGNDYIIGNDGKNTIDGGEGERDVLTFEPIFYTDGMKGIKVDLDKGTVLNPWGKTDKVKGIEDVRGTIYADTFIGSKRNEFFSGMAGNDTFTGGKGNDQFDYSNGDDKDKIKDFGNGDDTVVLSQLGVSTFGALKKMMEQKGDNVVIDFEDGDTLTFLGFDKRDFSKNDFEFFDF